MKVTLGGERLGSGNKQTLALREFERSSHDLGYTWRSTASAGTLLPFMSEVGLPGDTFEINLQADGKTLPTVGPLFGSYKIQLDVFTVPITPYNARLHMNELGIGNNMGQIYLPQVELRAKGTKIKKDMDNSQINGSALFSYLNIRGIGVPVDETKEAVRQFNAIPYLGYWDIYKNYYANKQEEVGYVIHNNYNVTNPQIYDVIINETEGSQPQNIILKNSRDLPTERNLQGARTDGGATMVINCIAAEFDKTKLFISHQYGNQFGEEVWEWVNAADIWNTWTILNTNTVAASDWNTENETTNDSVIFTENYYYETGVDKNGKPQLQQFPLTNIDQMRKNIMRHQNDAVPFVVNWRTFAPYGLPMQSEVDNGEDLYGMQSSQEGLGIKTYQSDLFNNWINTEWLDGENGINDITAVTVVDGKIHMNELNMANKIFNMLNRIAVSGGSYDDWMDAVYTHERHRRSDTPVYQGGLIKELTFQEVVSTAEASNGEQALGTLAGRGIMTNKHKGGHVKIRIDEPSYIMGIVSITPRVDYSQGNKWDTALKTMDDFHKPGLDEIGFQPLITEQMAWWDTRLEHNIAGGYDVLQNSAGKQPAWTNYMTNVNQIRGNFAHQDDSMFMVLDRRYEVDTDSFSGGIKDLTTYIDPSHYNHVFAQTDRTAQNFWLQIGLDITARRKMSAKVMPNL